MPVIEIRSYQLVPGSRAQFHQLVSHQSLPLMLDWGIDVMAFGPSLHDADSYFLIRAFHDLASLEATQAAFYSSPAWRSGPREAIVQMIVADSNLVMEMSHDHIDALRNRAFASTTGLAEVAYHDARVASSLKAAAAHAEFCALHAQAVPLVLPNVWDAASAALFQRAGAPAVATSSAALAWSLGYADGSNVPRHELLAAIARIQRVLTIPLSVDLEDGYSDSAKEVADLVVEVAQMGVAGINLEDGAQPSQLLAEKIAACRQALGARPLFINARTDVCLRGLATGAAALDLILQRAETYQVAGADGLFVPGMSGIDDTAYITARTAMPVNLMLLPDLPAIPALFAAGARRFTAGPANFLAAYGHTFTATQALLDTHHTAELFTGMAVGYADMNAQFA